MSETPENAEFVGYVFRDPSLLQRALTHSSYAAENPECISNERLEFLGDAVLGLVLADHLYRRLDAVPESKLTQLRSHFVSEDGLSEPANRAGLQDSLLLGAGATKEMARGMWSSSPNAAALEAVFGAVYLDAGGPGAGLEAVQALARRIWHEDWEDVDHWVERDLRDPTTRFVQDYEKKFGNKPRFHYEQVEVKGPRRPWRATIEHSDEAWGTGIGPNRKKAAREACRQALQHLLQLGSE